MRWGWIGLGILLFMSDVQSTEAKHNKASQKFLFSCLRRCDAIISDARRMCRRHKVGLQQACFQATSTPQARQDCRKQNNPRTQCFAKQDMALCSKRCKKGCLTQAFLIPKGKQMACKTTKDGNKYCIVFDQYEPTYEEVCPKRSAKKRTRRHKRHKH